MNRFTQKRNTSHILRRVAAAAVVFICAAFLLIRGASSMSDTASTSQLESLRQAIVRSAVHCYAMEGAYPESIDYLKEHYGISWDEKKYVVDYEITGSNLMPGVFVFEIGKGAE